MSDNLTKYTSEFWSFYGTTITNETKLAWLNSTENSYDFYRCFVPLYYKILNNATNQNIKNLRKLQDHIGWVFGDPHPGNFGAVLTNNSPLKYSVIYTVNDPDDGIGDSPMYIDLLRFLTGVRIIGNDCNPVDKIYNAYIQGLKGCSLINKPKEIKKCLKRLWKKEKSVKKRDYKRFYEDKKGKANLPIFEISTLKLKELNNNLQNEWKDYDLKVVEGFEYIRKKGGSGGLPRKVLLVKFSQQSHPVRISKSRWLVFEFKGIRQSSAQYLSEFSTVEVKEAKKQTMVWLSNNKPSKLYHIVKEDQYWIVRPRWVENPVVDPKQVKKKNQRKEIYLYQAKVLGSLHRAKAINSKAYIDDLKQINSKEWKKAAKFMANELHQIWQNKDKINIEP